ncbi:MAG: hypothetical protein PHG27_04270 [Massilibacteroides sp.]|nr:hypothetical protein [Massilibacteroides sp.]
MKKRILYITALTAIIAPIFLTGTINPFICIYIHLFGIILFVFRANRELRLMFVLLFLWFDFFFCLSPDMPTYQNRFSKAGIALSKDQKEKIRIECDTELYDSINHYLKYPPNADAIKELDLGNSSLQDTLSIAITIAEKNIGYVTFFGNTDDVKIYKYSYYNSLFKTNRYHWGERTEAGDGNYGPVIYDVTIYGYLPDFYKELEKRITFTK